MRNVRRRSASNPGSTRDNASKLRSKSPAPASSVTERATCTPTSDQFTPKEGYVWVAAGETSAPLPVHLLQDLAIEQDYGLKLQITHFNGKKLKQPTTLDLLVREGQRVVAGETVIARWTRPARVGS